MSTEFLVLGWGILGGEFGESFQGVTRIGATGLRASERGNLPLRGSLRGPLKTSQKSLKTPLKTKTSEDL